MVAHGIMVLNHARSWQGGLFLFCRGDTFIGANAHFFGAKVPRGLVAKQRIGMRKDPKT